MVSDSVSVYAGSNEDSVIPLTLLWSVPSGKNSYARICLGYKMAGNSVQGGMNEKGLFVDGNSLGRQGWIADKSKKSSTGSILDIILAKCANIEDVKEYFRTYNVPTLDRARIPVMDKSGASMIVEWYNGKVTFLQDEKKYQIATNFIGSKYVEKDKPCWRYNNAEEILKVKSSYSLNDVEAALDASHVEEDRSTTVYSFICDLKKGEIFIYNYHDFDNPIKVIFDEEIEKGKNEHYLNKLFSENSHDYENFIEEGPVHMIKRAYNMNKMNGMAFYNILKTRYPIAFNKELGINALSAFGNSLIEKGNLEDAIFFLARNATDNPDSDRAHFELGDAYLRNRDKEKAELEFKKVLQIDPEHKKAKTALEKLNR